MKPRHIRLVGSALVAAGFAVSVPAQAQNADPKPLLVIMLDTSGSMEWTAGNAVSASVELDKPNCEPQKAGAPVAGKIYLKSRLIAAQEVLTGSFEDYWCRQDNRDVNYTGEMDIGYVLEHHDACSGADPTTTGVSASCRAPRQRDNGLLDLRYSDFKFALTTFHPYRASDINFNTLFEYGPDRTSGLNLGIRNDAWGIPNIADAFDEATNAFTDNSSLRATENVGRLIMPAVDDSLDAQALYNIAAQREILRLRGFSATPLGPMLEDVKSLLEKHPTTQPPAGSGTSATGDPYYECRRRIAVLITDGRSNPEDGSHGYSDTVTAMWALKNTEPTPVSVYVVGYNLAETDASVLSDLDPENGGPAEAMLIADSPAELAAALAQITSAELQGRRSRTTTVYTNATRSAVDLQYQFNAAYDADPNYAINQVGYLNQTVYGCNAACAAVMSTGRSCAQDIHELHTRLNARSSPRDILFHINGDLVDLVASPPGTLFSTVDDYVAQFGLPTTGLLPQVAPGSTGAGGIPVADPFATLGPATDLQVASTYLDQLVSYVRADSGTMRCIDSAQPSLCQRMGAIRRSTPVVQEPQVAGKFPLRSWNEYVRKVDSQSNYSPQCRPTVLYTGTHDGLIHAFRVDNLQTRYGECAKQTSVPVVNEVGEELWSIVPQELFKRSHSLVNSTAFLMDGALVVDDVLLTRSDPENADPEDEALNWRSVLTASYGRGGRGYIAIDVTNPMSIDTVDVMWEISNTSHCSQGKCKTKKNGKKYNFKRLGLSGAEAAYATAFIDGKEVAIALLPGGENVAGEWGSGRVLYVVRLDNGEKLAEFRHKGANVIDETGATGGKMRYPITGTPAAYPNLPGSVASRAFVGDAGGRMWRLNMVRDPDTWTMELYYDPYGPGGIVTGGNKRREPVHGAPRLALTGDFGHLAVVYATGDIDLLSNGGTTRGGVFSFSEVTQADQSLAMEPNWHRVLAEGETITGEPEVFNKVAYWSTFHRDSDDACQGGEGFVYGVHYTTGTGGSGEDTTVGQLDEDGDPATVDLVNRKSTGTVVPYGVQVIERPACFAAGSSINAGGLSGSGAQGISRGAVELVVGAAEGQFSSPSTVPPGVDPGSLKTPTMTETLNDTGETVQSAAWGLVLY